MKKGIAAAVVIVVILAVLFTLNAGKRPDKLPAKGNGGSQSAPDIRLVAAEGRVEALPGFEVEVGSEIEGRIAEIYVEEGSEVKKGDLIARMEDRDIRAKLKEAKAEADAARAKYREVASGARDEEVRRAEAALDRARADAENARREAERYLQLYEKGMVSRSSYEEMERAHTVAVARQKEADEERALLKQGPKTDTIAYYQDSARRAEASVQYAGTILDKTLITAPISGKVIRRYLQKGEMVSKDVTPHLVAIADPSKIRVNAEVDETDIAQFSVGDPVEITSYAYPGRTFNGTVQEIADYAGLRKVLPNNPTKNRDMKIVQVKIGISEKIPLKLGMTVDVKIRPKQ